MIILIADFGCSCIFLKIKCSLSETYLHTYSNKFKPYDTFKVYFKKCANLFAFFFEGLDTKIPKLNIYTKKILNKFCAFFFILIKSSQII